MKKEKILVGLSGGVDSAVTATLLLQQGYEVMGGFMKNYVSEKSNCTTYQDAEEAIKVAKHLGIELLSFDLQQEYQEQIIDYIFASYEKGITPNPDVLCNSLIKFDVFLKKALELGFDKIATGHYARIQGNQLLRGIDHHKDQSYFLAGLNQFQLSHSLFPLGALTKPEVRTLAKKFGLPNAERKDSQGLCFIGNIPIREFLLQRFPKKEGDIIYVNPEHDDNYGTNANPTQIGCKGRSCTSSDSAYGGVTVGTHQGAYFYTIGQKYGLGLNFKAYIYRIDIKHNLLYVTDKDSEKLQTKTLIAKNWHRINTNQIEATSGKIRYRQNPPVPCTLQVYDTPGKGKYDYHTKSISEGGKVLVQFSEPQRAVAPGQIFVAYNGEICLGCGAIS